MAVLLHPESRDQEWLAAFVSELPDVDFRLWPDIGDPADIDFAVLCRHDADDLKRYDQLRAILAMGAGVEQFTGLAMPDVPVVRLVDPGMSDEMATYALHWVVHFQRHFDSYRGHEADALWRTLPSNAAPDHAVGIMGYGNIGRRVTKVFEDLGYPVNAWSRSGGPKGSVTHYAGMAELAAFIGASKVVVNILPNTAETRGLLDAALFREFNADAGLVNMGRGATVDEAALIEALDRGHLRFAVLDVTSIEPLPETSPLWSHPQVTITPHIAGDTLPATASKVISDNLRRLMAGEAPFPLYERARDY